MSRLVGYIQELADSLEDWEEVPHFTNVGIGLVWIKPWILLFWKNSILSTEK